LLCHLVEPASLDKNDPVGQDPLYLVAIRENVAALKKQGRSRDETVAAKPTAAFDAKWGNSVIDPGFFTRMVYEGV
jgi:hypothetical protein